MKADIILLVGAIAKLAINIPYNYLISLMAIIMIWDIAMTAIKSIEQERILREYFAINSKSSRNAVDVKNRQG